MEFSSAVSAPVEVSTLQRFESDHVEGWEWKTGVETSAALGRRSCPSSRGGWAGAKWESISASLPGLWPSRREADHRAPAGVGPMRLRSCVHVLHCWLDRLATL